jgi:hypothetical protein
MRHATTDPLPGLSNLDSVLLLPEHEEQLARLRKYSLGSPTWRMRKYTEARDLLALVQIAPRMTLLALEGTTALRAIVRLRTTVPCLTPGADDLVVGDTVDLAIRYREEMFGGVVCG